jgi:hypothetical protein
MAYTNAVKTTTLNRLSINTLLAPYVGSWGVDTTNDNVWAVLDYSAMAGTPLTPAYFATSYGLPTGGVGTVDAKGSFLLTPQTTSTNMLFGNVLRGAVVPGMTATIHNIGDLGAVGMDATYQNDLASPFSGAVSATNIALGGPPAVQTITLNTGTSGNYADAATFLCYNTGTVTPLQTTLLLNASATVGWGKADRSNSMSAFGAALTALVGTPSGTYANLESNVHEEINGPAGAPMLGSVATILWGTNLTGSDTGVSMAWRTRLNAASVPNEQSFLISDVLRLTGMNNSLASPQTDKFVLQMKYSEAELLIHLAGGRTEADVAAAGLLYLETWDPTLGTSGMWANAISTNINNDPTAPHGVLGAFDPGISNDLKLGAWGVDVNNDVVWAVLDHNGDFAVAPEPATMAFLMFGGMAMAGAGIARRRRGSKKS